MEWFDSGWGLSLVVFLPLVGALVLAAIPRANETVMKWVALITAIVTFVLSIVVALRFNYGAAADIQFGTNLPWIETINANYHIGIDGISLPLVVLSTFITLLVVIYSWEHWPEPHNPKLLLALIMILATGMTGTFVALDLILFFVFFEIVLLPMYFMIGIWGDFDTGEIRKKIETAFQTWEKTNFKREGKKTFAVMQVNGKLEDKPIELGWRDAGRIEVVSGLNEGDAIGIPNKPKKRKGRRPR